MPVTRPLRRTYRAFRDGNYTLGGRSNYVLHPLFAVDARHYIRAFLLLQEDLQKLFEYIEPSDSNLGTYSFRAHDLLLRACIEVEASCKAILKENRYIKKGNLAMDDYRRLNKTHLLSSYEVQLPYWRGEGAIRKPFAEWADGTQLPWYDAYNAAKHDRLLSFEGANLRNVVDSCCGALAVLSAQFGTHAFSGLNYLVAAGGIGDGMESAIGGYFRIKFPDNWPAELQYDFDWQELKKMQDPFEEYDYSKG